MIALLDPSATVAIMAGEPEAFAIERRFEEADDVLCPAVSLWETRAVAQKRKVSMAIAQAEVDSFVADFALRLVTIGGADARAAVAAHDRNGQGQHPARLGMGDCFAYACAETNRARLLYKGGDFAPTDLA